MGRRKFSVLLAVALARLMVVSSSSSARVSVTGATSASGNAGNKTQLVNISGSQTIRCSGIGSTLQVNLSADTTGSYPITVSSSVGLNFSSCTLIVVAVTVSCSNMALNVTASTVSAKTTMAVVGIQCDIRLGTGTTSTCHVVMTGSMGNYYTNADHSLVVDQNHLSLAMTGSPSGCSLKNSTSTRYVSFSGGNVEYFVSPAVSINAA
jgi:hypothetical protein